MGKVISKFFSSRFHNVIHYLHDTIGLFLPMMTEEFQQKASLLGNFPAYTKTVNRFEVRHSLWSAILDYCFLYRTGLYKIFVNFTCAPCVFEQYMYISFSKSYELKVGSKFVCTWLANVLFLTFCLYWIFIYKGVSHQCSCNEFQSSLAVCGKIHQQLADDHEIPSDSALFRLSQHNGGYCHISEMTAAWNTYKIKLILCLKLMW